MSTAIILAYRTFAPIRLRPPIDWRQNPFHSSNWVHNFLSLRWLSRLPEEQRVIVISDHFRWIDEDQEARSYLSGRKRDHTSAIRLGILSDIFEQQNQEIDQERVKTEIVNLVDELVDTETYKLGHNHGLIIDESILTLANKRCGYLITEQQLHRVLTRVHKQIDSIFDEGGYTLEHSISYQEYNLLVLNRIDELLKKFDISDDARTVSRRIKTIRNASAKLLGHALRRNGEYIPFGDSFRQPNWSILRKVNGWNDPKEELQRAALDSKHFVAERAGFGFFRNDDWHFGITSSNNLGSHKQEDELSVFIEYRGSTLVDDAGYTDAIDELKSQIRRRESHSTCRIFSTNGEVLFHTSRAPQAKWVTKISENSFKGFLARAELRAGGRAWRLICLIENFGVLVADWCKGIEGLEKTSHRFILGQELNYEHSDSIKTIKLDISSGCFIQSLQQNPPSAVGSIAVIGGVNTTTESRSWIDWNGNPNDINAFIIYPEVSHFNPITLELNHNNLKVSTIRSETINIPF